MTQLKAGVVAVAVCSLLAGGALECRICQRKWACAGNHQAREGRHCAREGGH